MLIICFIAEQIEKLGVHDGNNKVESVIRITDNDKHGCFLVAQHIKLHLSYLVSSRSSAISNVGSLAPQLIRIDFAVLPVTKCQ